MIELPDILICIDNSSLTGDLLACPLIRGQEYRPQSVRRCKCGQLFVDVGIYLNTDQFNTGCHHCRQRFYDNVWWFDIRRFRLPENKLEMASFTVEQLLQELD